ncbi:restriction endonuclease subunit S [Pseudomonas asiatica]|uniref:restriction endonuclease subunit S n=1 Tax=Pseudomonas asiatica TaxID=2219225 RepID=UPI0018AA7E95|nr:restriction endonuclease subunit S [Pseudomonas asiatica]MBF8805587.1 restriction endonuclease subunit S [Pseudomonas asiatica]
MSAEIRPGYKMTEVGVIPGDWRVLPLKDVLARGRLGGNYANTALDTAIPLMKMGNLARGSFAVEKLEYVCGGQHLEPEHRLRYGDVLFNTRNTLDLVGKVAIWRDELPLAYYNSNLMRLEFDKDVVCSNEYANYALNLESAIGRLRAIATGTTSVAAIYTRDLLEFCIPVPPKEEQVLIGQALSNVDVLIGALDQLLSKKRNLKQAAMQQLLTGRQRLPEFSGEWEMTPMRALGNTYGGLSGKTKNDFGHGEARYIPFMNVMGDTVIDPSWLESVDVAPDEVQSLAKKGDLFFNGSSETPEEVGFCSVLLEEIPSLYLNSFCFGFRFNSAAKVNGLFFAYWFRSKAGRAAMSVLAQGATRYNIAKSAFMRLEIPQPSEAEQTAIATILSDMDAEIAALEARRDKARQLKQGMMQELLTGRIRLV